MNDFIDARNIPEDQNITTDICIVGTGPAGMTLVKELKDQPFKVLVLESGDLEFDQDTQNLYKGNNLGHRFLELNDGRNRFYGGTSNTWKGWCRPLDEVDFEKRAWVPYSGWPFDKSELDSFYERAHKTCQLGPYDYTSHFRKTDEILPLDPKIFSTQIFLNKPIHFGKTYLKEVKQSSNVVIYLNANVLNAETNQAGTRVSHLNVSSLEKNKFKVTAKYFILATGGIENPRLLLVSNKFQEKGLGNQNDLVGRFFMEHFALDASVMRLSGKHIPKDISNQFLGNGLVWRKGIFFTDEAIRRNKILNIHMFLSEPVPNRSEKFIKAQETKGVKSFSHILQKLTKVDSEALRQKPDRMLEHFFNILKGAGNIAYIAANFRSKRTKVKHFNHQEKMYWISNGIEQSPNPDSRVTLSDTKKDVFGNSVANLDWRFNELDKKSFRIAHKILAEELERTGVGKLQITINEGDEWPFQMTGGSHHMGTTRIHENPKQGVVDPDCRIHGVSNMFIAGSSVFPTGGHANPTLTIVALSIRLADHIKKILV